MTRRSGRGVVLPVALLLAAAGAVASVAPLGVAIGSIHRSSSTTGDLHLAGILFSYPSLNGAAWLLLGLALIGAAAITRALRTVLRQWRAYRRLLTGLAIIDQLRPGSDVLVIDDPRSVAFCAGYLRPRIYVSKGALDLLTETELEAVLAHEHHHRRVRDPLRFACGRILSRSLFFVPALRALVGRYTELAELNADDAALQVIEGGRAALASALLAFDSSGAGIAPERVDSLLGRQIGWRCPWRLLIGSVCSVLGLTALTWIAGQGASARATFDLPLLSSRPCLAMLLILLPAFVTFSGRRAAARQS
jgi:Zn-dependent protease with chaperone function